MTENKKPRVLVGSDFYSPHWTGIVKSIANMVQVLGDKIDFTVVTVLYDTNLPKEEEIGNARVIREPYLLKLSRGFYSIAAVIRFAREVLTADAVLISSPSMNILPMSILTKFFGRKLVIFHQGDLILPEGIINKVIEKAFFVCTWISMWLADVVSTYTRDYGEHSKVLSPFIHKFQELMAPILIEPLGSELPKAIFPLKELRDNDKFIFGFGGRFVNEKGFDVLFKAIPKVIQALPNAHFVFAGETRVGYEDTFNELGDLLKPVEQHITFLGLLKKEELTWFYELIDCIVISSRSDCCPLVQMEACLWGTPSVCSDIPGARQIVKRSGFGHLFESENSEDLTNKLIEFYHRASDFEQKWENVKAAFNENVLADKIQHALLD